MTDPTDGPSTPTGAGGPSPSADAPVVTSSTVLGDDWVLGDDGLRFRRAARVLLLDAEDRLLLVRGHDVDQPERSFTWWDYRMNAFRRKMGLRIDHMLLSPALAAACRSCTIDTTPRALERPSDHAPVICEIAA